MLHAYTGFRANTGAQSKERYLEEIDVTRTSATRSSVHVGRTEAVAVALIGIPLSACAPRLDSARYASDQAHCPPTPMPSAEERAKMSTEAVRLRAQTAEVERQTFVVSGGQSCLGNGAHVEAWSSLLQERTRQDR